MDLLMDWLLKGEPWVAYRARIDLLEQSESDLEVVQAHQAALADVKIQSLIDELNEWPGFVLKSHKKAGHLLHKLSFLAAGETNLNPFLVGVCDIMPHTILACADNRPNPIRFFSR